MSAYRHAVSNIPTSISHCADTIYIMCQFRRPANASPDDPISLSISTLHGDGSAPALVKSMLLETFRTQPMPSALQNAIEIRDVTFVSMAGHSPTYAIKLSAKTPASFTPPIPFYKYGSDTYAVLKEYLHSLVYERWHVKTESLHSALNITKTLLEATFFIVPPLNYPLYKSIAYLSGIPPQVYGKRRSNIEMLLDSFHQSIKSNLDTASPLQHVGYFKESVGLQARTNFNFTQGAKADLYILFVSNHEALASLSPILFCSTASLSTPQMMGIPVTFFPIPTRPPSTELSRTASFYGAIEKIHQDITLRQDLIIAAPSFVTSCIRNPTSRETRDLLLQNKKIVSFAIVHTKTKHVQTKLILTEPLPVDNEEPTLRRWFRKAERKAIFADPNETRTPHSLPPDSILLNNVLRNTTVSLAAFASALGVPVPRPTPPVTDHNNAKETPTFARTTTVPSPKPALTKLTSLSKKPQKSNSITPAALLTQAPMVSPQPDPPPPNLPLLADFPESGSSLLSPRKDRNWDSDSSHTEANLDGSPSSPSDADDEDEDDMYPSQSVRIVNYEQDLVKALPRHLRSHVNPSLLAELAQHIYLAEDVPSALKDSKNDLLGQTETAHEKLMSRHKRTKSPKKKLKKHAH